MSNWFEGKRFGSPFSHVSNLSETRSYLLIGWLWFSCKHNWKHFKLFVFLYSWVHRLPVRKPLFARSWSVLRAQYSWNILRSFYWMGSVIFINRYKNLCFLGTVQFVVLSNSLHKSSVNSFWRKDSSRFHSVIRIFLENVFIFCQKKLYFFLSFIRMQPHRF